MSILKKEIVSIKLEDYSKITGDINYAVSVIASSTLFSAPPAFTTNSFEKESTLKIIKQSIEWLKFVERYLCQKNKINALKSSNIYIDALFSALFDEIKFLGKDKVYDKMLSKFKTLDHDMQTVLIKYFDSFFLWGNINIQKEDYGVFRSRAESLFEHADDFIKLYRRLNDYRSKFTLLAFVLNWYELNFDYLKRSKENIYDEYFDHDIIKCDENEVFVDLGAFNGDTVCSYVKNYGKMYKRIYCYEILPQSFQKLQQCIISLNINNVVLNNNGVLDKVGIMNICEHTYPSAARLSIDGNCEVKVVTLDEDITEPITFLKMDIEGAEQGAIRGAKKHIANDKPKMAISVYHNNEDIWKIPKMIDEFCQGYSFYLRYRGGNLIPSELTLLAVYDS